MGATEGETSGHAGVTGNLGQLVPPNPATILGAGRVDPFANYPIRITDVDQYILDQCESQIHRDKRYAADLRRSGHNCLLYSVPITRSSLANIQTKLATYSGK